MVTGLNESVHQPFKSRFWVPYSLTVFLNVISLDFQSPVYLGVVSPMQNLRVGVLCVDLSIMLLTEEVHTFDTTPNCDLPQLGCGVISSEYGVSFSIFPLDTVLLSFVMKALFIKFSNPFQWELFCIQLQICCVHGGR